MTTMTMTEWPRWKVLMLGQLVSLLYFCGSALTSTLQTNFAFCAPNFTAFVIYAVLSLFLLPVYCSSTSTTATSIHSRGERRQERLITSAGHDNNEVEECCCRIVEDDDESYTTSASSSSSISSSSTQEQQCQQPTLFLNVLPIRGDWKAYALIGLVDYAGIVASIGSLKLTSLTSFTILFATITPFAMLFSTCFLVRTYTARHFIGVALCLIGVAVSVWHDSRSIENHADDDDGSTLADAVETTVKSNPHSYKLLGDALAVLGAAFYGLLDILCEYTLEHSNGGTAEYLGMTALFASLYAVIPALIWEQDAIARIVVVHDSSSNWSESGTLLVLLLLLVAAEVGSNYYSCRFLEVSESALLNLSTLTENVMAVLFAVLYLQTGMPAPLFFAGLTLTVAGLAVYETAPSPILDDYDDDATMLDELPFYYKTTIAMDDDAISLTEGFSEDFFPSTLSEEADDDLIDVVASRPF